MMKTNVSLRRALSALALLLALCLTLPAMAEGAQTATVSASGSATVRYAPDSAVVSLGVSTKNERVVDAQNANNAAMTAVLEALRALGVADEDLQTGSYSVSPQYDYEYGKLVEQEHMTSYEVSNTVTVIIRNIDQVGALLDAAVAAGANQSYGLTFQGSGQPAAYDAALQAATKEALRKADLLAAAAGCKAGAVLSITEDGAELSFSARDMNSLTAYDTAAAIETGTLTATAAVTVTLTLE